MTSETVEISKTHIAEEIARMLSRVLANASVTADSDFFKVGGDSLAAMELMAAIEEKFGLVVDAVVIFERPNIRDFAEAVDWMLKNPGWG